jgi:uncharacterized protein
MTQADEIIKKLDLAPHPEGGYYRETFRDNADTGRAVSTAILFLLKDGEMSHWHRIDATEIWHWHAGAALELRQSCDTGGHMVLHLGGDLFNDQQPQIVVPALTWQSAKSLGDWTLVGCTVAPGFEFNTFEMAPEKWSP